MTKQPGSERERDPQKYYWPVGDFVGAILFMAMAVFFIVEASRMPQRGASGFITAAGFTPTLLGVIVLVLNVILIRLVVKTYGYRSVVGWARNCIADEIVRRWLILTLIIGGYVLLVGKIPFVWANAIFFAAIFAFLKAGNWWQVLLYTAIGAGVVGYVVPWLFAMPMP